VRGKSKQVFARVSSNARMNSQRAQARVQGLPKIVRPAATARGADVKDQSPSPSPSPLRITKIGR
jgi:hypothetical protein